MALLCLAVTIGLIAVQLAPAQQPADRPAEQDARPQVGVMMVEAQAHKIMVQGYGSATSRYQQALTSAVSGRVERVSEIFEAGQWVAAGTPLVMLESAAFAAQVASAQRELADAKVAWLEEQRSSQQAKQEWYASQQGEPESELVLRGPQLQAAKARLQQAEADLQQALQQQHNSVIRAPFDAIITERNIAVGDYLTAGSHSGELLSSDSLYIRVPLSLLQWQQLPSREQLLSGDWQAWVEDIETGQRWQARVAQVDQHIDSEQRQRAITLQVEQPLQQQPALYPGTFVSAKLEGNTQPQVWRLPPSVLTASGHIWYVDGQQHLVKLAADIIGRDDDAVYVQPPEALTRSAVAIVRHPLTSYQPAMAVIAVEQQEVADVSQH